MLTAYDPYLLPDARAEAEQAARALADVLQRKQTKAEQLRNGEAPKPADLRLAHRLETEVEAATAYAGAMQRLLAAHAAELETALDMVRLSDTRTASLHRKAAECQDEATAYHLRFDALLEAFQTYVQKSILKNAA